VQLLYLASYIVVLQCFSFVVGQGIPVPMGNNALLYQGIEAWNIFHCTILKILCKDNILLAQFKTFCAKKTLPLPKCDFFDNVVAVADFLCAI
jgi:hypothetical protein